MIFFILDLIGKVTFALLVAAMFALIIVTPFLEYVPK